MEKGDRVKFKKMVTEHLADEGFGPMCLAETGDLATVVREDLPKRIFVVTDKGARAGQEIWVFPDEIEKIDSTQEGLL